MKRFISLMLCIVMLLSLLTGCAQPKAEKASGIYKKGVYKTEADGHNGKIKVEVTVEAEKIASIKVLEHKETAGLSDPAINNIPKKIIEEQSLAIDTVAGATYTSKAILTAVEAAIVQAGGDIKALKVKKQTEKTAKKITKDIDVVVVGGGMAGLSAALEAANNGAKVILLEKMPAVGGSTVRSGGKILAANTSFQQAAGIKDDPKDFAKFLMEIGENKVDKSFIDLIANNSAAQIEWLVSNGVKLSSKIEPLHSSRTPARGHFTENGSGAGFTQPLEAKLKEKGVEILYQTPAISLIQNQGKVVGVNAKNTAGDEYTINAKAVILATGGFTRNPEMIAKYYPSAGKFVTGVGDGNTGDGITMGLSAGADLVMPDGGINLTLNHQTYYGYGEEADGLFVTPAGERFMNEKLFHFTRTRIMMDLKIDNCWYVFDEKTFNDRVAKAIEAKGAVEASSIEELATKMKADPAKLKATVDEYNKMAKAGKDTKFNKEAKYMKPIEKGKFYAVNLIMSNSGTHGGLKINIDGQVIDTKGAVIPGLYAAGEVASGQILNKEYPGSGTALISFLTFGRQAGKSAAKLVK